MLRLARTDPERLAIGIDADAASMRTASARASRPKTAVPNAIFVVATAEDLPDDLAGVADRITVNFPWGSLLRGIVTGDARILGEIARVASAGADLTVLWSITPRDLPAVGVTPSSGRSLAVRFRQQGLEVAEIRPASLEEIRNTGSSWAKRLGAGAQRPVTLLRATRR